jgi:uncharacterized protein HemX
MMCSPVEVEKESPHHGGGSVHVGELGIRHQDAVPRGDTAMRRLRLSTVMLLVIIVGLGTGYSVQQQRAARREAKIAELQRDVDVLTEIEARSQRSKRSRPQTQQSAEKRATDAAVAKDE